MYKQLGYSLALLFLGRMTAYDIRWKKIPAVWVAAAGIVAVIYFAMGKQCSINTAVLCMLPGFVLLLLSALTGEGIGYGAINHPVDRDPVCGYVGIINDVCPCCGRHAGESISLEKLNKIKGGK